MDIADQDGKSRAVSGSSDANGRTIMHAAPPVLGDGQDTQVFSVSAGSYQSFALAPGFYRLDADMDVWLKSSMSSGLYGANLIGGAKNYATASQSLATVTGLNLGSTDFTIEAWAELRTGGASGRRLLDFGAASGNARLVLEWCDNSAVLKPQVTLVDGAGSAIVTSGYNTTAVPLDTNLHHLVAAIQRSGGAGSIINFYVDGQLAAQDTYTDGGGVCNLSNVSSGGRLVIGGTLGLAGLWDGRVEDIKIYSGAAMMSLSQAQARNAAGPNRSLATLIDAFDAKLGWWVSFQNQGAWNSAAVPEPEVGFGNLGTAISRFSTNTGSAAIDERTSGAAASPLSSPRILGCRPETYRHAGTYLNIYSGPGASGQVRLTLV